MFHRACTKNLNAHNGRINIKLHCILLCFSHIAYCCVSVTLHTVVFQSHCILLCFSHIAYCCVSVTLLQTVWCVYYSF